MVLGFVEGALISAFLQVLFDRLASRQFLGFFRNRHFDETLFDRLKTVLLTVNAVLSDAEEKQITNLAVKEWVNELKDAVYHADDLLDEIDTKALQCEVEARAKVNGKAKLKGKKVLDQLFTHNPCNGDKESTSKLDKNIESRLKRIVERLECLANQRDLLNLKGSEREKPPPMLPTTSLVNESEVFGRDSDKDELVKFLLADNAQENKIPLIAIVGIGGVGKTTLAQLLYNDSRVKQSFELRAWAYVSEEFNVSKITRTIYESVSSEVSHVKDLDVLQVRLEQKLKGKRFLLVLDDIWNEKFIDWDLLSCPLKDGADGSRIIVTTRNQGVASIMRADTYPLLHLSDDVCWSLFARHAFRTSNFEGHETLIKIGSDIVRKCSGLPLAAKTLGCLLHSKVEEKEWRGILDSKIWDLPNDKSSILPTLRLSYYHLPSHLKQCFAYCSIFPKGYEFEKEKLILLWMAEGFLQQPKGKETMEEVGDVYFRELLSRSFFQPSNHKKWCFVMHDLVNDLAQFVAGEFCCKFEDGKSGGFSGKTRHFACLADHLDGPEKFVALPELKSLRTFLPLSFSNSSYNLSTTVCDGWLPIMKHLHVLSLSCYKITKLPDSLGGLIYLRYLDLSQTLITELPSSTCSLYNLQTLLLSRCRNLNVLPTNSFGQLIHLRHLDLSQTLISELPSSTCSLYNLQTLLLSRCHHLTALPANSLDQLIHLRYLDLSQTLIRELPSSTCSLYNLRTLLLSGCGRLTVLPANIGNLVNLRHLDVSGTSLIELPPEFGRLKSLQVLTDFVVSRDSGSKISELGGLSHLHGTLSISKLEYIVDATDASEANLKSKTFLNELVFKWTYDAHGVRNQTDILDNLRPHQNLKKLTIEKYGGTRFPNWLGDSIFSNMVILRLSQCRNCTSLPSLGQLSSLQELYIEKMEGLQTLGSGFCGNGPFSFRSLQVLQIQECPELIGSLPEHSCLPCLQKLELSNCPKLSQFSECNLPLNLKSLFITNCNNLTPKREWGLQGMVSLTCFEIEGGCSNVKSFPEEGLLPNTLTSLRISRLPNLESLDKGLQDLTSLETLDINGCEKLKLIPAEGLPTTLTSLFITECLLLGPRCQEGGVDRPKISRIADIHIPHNYSRS